MCLQHWLSALKHLNPEIKCKRASSVFVQLHLTVQYTLQYTAWDQLINVQPAIININTQNDHFL